jgi:hypothetical protein
MGADAMAGHLRWVKSSFSGEGDCVEWACGVDFVAVRDSKYPNGPVLRFTWSEWTAFISGVAAGEAEPTVGD